MGANAITRYSLIRHQRAANIPQFLNPVSTHRGVSLIFEGLAETNRKYGLGRNVQRARFPLASEQRRFGHTGQPLVDAMVE